MVSRPSHSSRHVLMPTPLVGNTAEYSGAIKRYSAHFRFFTASRFLHHTSVTSADGWPESVKRRRARISGIIGNTAVASRSVHDVGKFTIRVHRRFRTIASHHRVFDPCKSFSLACDCPTCKCIRRHDGNTHCGQLSFLPQNRHATLSRVLCRH